MSGTTQEQELIAQLTEALAESNDLLSTIFALTKVSRKAVEIPNEFWARQIYKVLDCKSLALISPEGSYWEGDPEQPRLLEALWKDSPAFQVLRSDESGMNSDCVLTRFDQSPGVGLVIELRDHCTTANSKLIKSASAYVDGAMALAKMQKVHAANELLTKDIKMAALVSEHVIPNDVPNLDGWNIYAKCMPARIASGDFFSFVETESGLYAAVADVSGKGLSASMAMTIIASAFARICRSEQPDDPAAVAEAINSELYEFLTDAQMFATLAVVTVKESKVQITNCGHSPVMVKEGQWRYVDAGCPPLGVTEDLGATTETFDSETFNSLLVGSDGLVEQTNANGDQLGYEAFFEMATSAAEDTDLPLHLAFCSRLAEFAGDTPQDDDRTLLAMEKKK